MPYLIDGHNLIPKLGLSLRNVEDEMQLVARLQAFYRMERKPIEVYFDGAPAGQVGTRKFGMVTAHFVRIGTTADSAIALRLKKMKREARNWTVVTSDRRVQSEARAVGAQVISSDEFAGMVIESMRAPAPGSASERGMSTEEVDEWLRLFRENKR